jgi:hypothetical protein
MSPGESNRNPKYKAVDLQSPDCSWKWKSQMPEKVFQVPYTDHLWDRLNYSAAAALNRDRVKVQLRATTQPLATLRVLSQR